MGNAPNKLFPLTLGAIARLHCHIRRHLSRPCHPAPAAPPPAPLPPRRQVLEGRKLVKAVKNVNSPSRKVYMLAELEPSRELTGGAWCVAGRGGEGYGGG